MYIFISFRCTHCLITDSYLEMFLLPPSVNIKIERTVFPDYFCLFHNPPLLLFVETYLGMYDQIRTVNSITTGFF